MGSIYQTMVKSKEKILTTFNNERKYKEIIAILDRRWSVQLHHPLLVVGHYFNPKYFYINLLIENDDMLLNDCYTCINKLSEGIEFIDEIHGRLEKYKIGVGYFIMRSTAR